MKDWLKNNLSNLLLAVSVIVIIVLLMNTTCTNRRLDIVKNNIAAMTDTLHAYKLKNGELMYEKQGFITKVGELEEVIGIKEKEIKDIEKQLKSAVSTIAKLEGQMRVDSVVMHDSIAVLPDSTARIFFDYTDSWLSLDGVTNYNLKYNTSSTMLNCMQMMVPLKVGTTEDDKWFATTPNPYIQFTSIEGANISKSSPKRWSIGVQGGLGVVGGVGLVGTQFKNITTTNTGAGWFVGLGGYVGFGLTYKITEF